MEKLNKNNLKSALNYARFQKNRYWRLKEEIHSSLLACLNKLSTLKEEELNKQDLRDIFSIMLDYIKANNLYEYYRSDCIRLNYGTINDENSKD